VLSTDLTMCMLRFVVNKNKPAKPVKEDVRQFLVDAEFTYEDFAQQSSGVTGMAMLRVQDYSWEEHGFSLAYELCGEIAQLLEDKFQTTQNLTYFTCVTNLLIMFCLVLCLHCLVCCKVISICSAKLSIKELQGRFSSFFVDFLFDSVY